MVNFILMEDKPRNFIKPNVQLFVSSIELIKLQLGFCQNHIILG